MALRKAQPPYEYKIRQLMIIKKINPAYRDQNISRNKESTKSTDSTKNLCFLATSPKRKQNESEEDWAVRFLETIATSSSEASDKKMNQS